MTNPQKRDARLGLRAGAFCWTIGSLFPAGIAWKMADEFGYSAHVSVAFLLFGLAMAIVMLAGSLLVPAELDRVWVSHALAGLGLTSFVFLTLSVGSAFLFVPTVGGWAKLGSVVVIFAAIATWCSHSLNEYKRRIISQRFMEREFAVQDEKIIVRQPIKTDLSSPPISEHTILGKIYHRAGPYLIMLVPMAYPIQRLLSDSAGFAAVLLLLSILCIPLTIYFLGRMACAAYLWIFKVWKLEKQHGKPVVFEVIPSQ